MRLTRLLIPAAILIAAVLSAKKKNPDDMTQTLALPKEPPAVAIGETRRLRFDVSPLSGKGLLSQQTRDALRAILKENGGVPVVHLRAFVAGSGDVRRIPQIVSEVFTEKKLPVPSVSVVLCGALPLPGAQVVIESVSSSRKDVNPGGLSFVAGGEMKASDPAISIRPLLGESLANLASKVVPAGALEVSCFVSNIENPAELTGLISSQFPNAVIDLVQTQRSPYQAFASCEGISRDASVTADKLAFTGTRVAFGARENDAILAFQRLDKDLADAGAPTGNVLFANVYSVNGSAVAYAGKLRTGKGPLVVVPFEGVASNEGGFAVDAIAAVSR